MALTSFVYFLGVNVHEICEGLQGPQYSALSEVGIAFGRVCGRTMC